MLTIFCFQRIIKERLIGLIRTSCQLPVVSCQFLRQLVTDNWQLVANSWRLILLNFFVVGFLSCDDLGRKEIVVATTIIIPKKEVLKDTLVLHANEGLIYYMKQPFSGYSVTYYPDGALAEKIAYWQGKKQGVYQKWYADGTLSFEANYEAGRKNGRSKTWWRDGGLRSESIHKMGMTHGNQRQWYQSGQLFKSMNIVNGKEEGLQQAWRENGKIYNNYEAKNGRIFGLKRASLCYELEAEIVQYAED